MLVYATACNIEEAAAALNSAACAFIGDAPPLTFSSGSEHDHASVINSMGALLMGWNAARERAQSLEAEAVELRGRLDASEDKLASRTRSSHTETKLLQEQAS